MIKRVITSEETKIYLVVPMRSGADHVAEIGSGKTHKEAMQHALHYLKEQCNYIENIITDKVEGIDPRD